MNPKSPESSRRNIAEKLLNRAASFKEPVIKVLSNVGKELDVTFRPYKEVPFSCGHQNPRIFADCQQRACSPRGRVSNS
jgi:hypothetical protein